MIRSIKKVLLLLILTFNIVFTQYPSASFESNEYSIGEHLGNYSVTLEIDNHDLLELWAYTIFLYADTSVIKLTDATWHSESPFQYTQFSSNVDNDTLRIFAYTASTGEMYSGEGGGILDISFDIVGEAGESTLLEFIRFQISASYIENTTDTNIILVSGVNCNDPTSCNYNVGSSSDIDCIPIPDGECCIVDDCSGLGDCDGNVDLGCGCGITASISYCIDTDTDSLGAGDSTYYCLADLPTGWVEDCSDLEPDCTTNDTDECGVCGGNGCHNQDCTTYPSSDYGCDGTILAPYNSIIPDMYSIHSIYPNPFNPVTHIRYSLPEHTDVRIIVYNILGKQIDYLVNNFQSPSSIQAPSSSLYQTKSSAQASEPLRVYHSLLDPSIFHEAPL